MDAVTGDTCWHCRKPIVRCGTVPPHAGCGSGHGWIHSNPEQWGHSCEPRSGAPYAQPTAPAAALLEAVAAVLTAAGERPAARGKSGWKLSADGDSAVLVNYRAAGTGEAVMKREAVARWMRVLGTSGYSWTVTGHGSRKLTWARVAATAAQVEVTRDGI